MGTILEKQEQKSKPERAKRTRLYPPTNPYALVAIALDIRPVISSMVSMYVLQLCMSVTVCMCHRWQVGLDYMLLNLLAVCFKMI